MRILMSETVSVKRQFDPNAATPLKTRAPAVAQHYRDTDVRLRILYVVRMESCDTPKFWAPSSLSPTYSSIPRRQHLAPMACIPTARSTPWTGHILG